MNKTQKFPGLMFLCWCEIFRCSAGLRLSVSQDVWITFLVTEPLSNAECIISCMKPSGQKVKVIIQKQFVLICSDAAEVTVRVHTCSFVVVCIKMILVGKSRMTLKQICRYLALMRSACSCTEWLTPQTQSTPLSMWSVCYAETHPASHLQIWNKDNQ